MLPITGGQVPHWLVLVEVDCIGSWDAGLANRVLTKGSHSPHPTHRAMKPMGSVGTPNYPSMYKESQGDYYCLLLDQEINSV